MKCRFLTALALSFMPLAVLSAAAHAACREFTQDVEAYDQAVETAGIACQDTRGTWHIQTRDGPERFDFLEPMRFGAIVAYPNPVFKYTRVLPRYVAPPPVETTPNVKDPAAGAADPRSRPLPAPGS